MVYSRFWLKAAEEESKSIPHEFPSSHWLKVTGQCVLERYLSATMVKQSYNGSVRGSPNGTIGKFSNGTIGSQWYHWLTNGTNGRANGTISITIGTNGKNKPMVPLVEP